MATSVSHEAMHLPFRIESITLWLCCFVGCAGGGVARHAPAVAVSPAVEVLILGTAQDGGLPHVGCRRAFCERARRHPGFARRVVSLAVLDHYAGKRFLVEATPDLPAQLDRLDALAPQPAAGRNPVDGVLVSHAHIGHYTGLIHFGREVASTQKLPFFGTERMIAFLRQSGPWSLLFELEQLDPHVLAYDTRMALTERCAVTAIRVPHRDEFSDTVAFRIEGPQRSLLFLPDIDRWDTWERRIEDMVRGVDVALLDATFYSAGELPGRDPSKVPHPLVIDSMARLKEQATKVIFIHLNHTNPLLDPDSPEARSARAAGFRIAVEGMRIPL
jgi:pyrroloquinoline quinone biosynthesis protein B